METPTPITAEAVAASVAMLSQSAGAMREGIITAAIELDAAAYDAALAADPGIAPAFTDAAAKLVDAAAALNVLARRINERMAQLWTLANSQAQQN